MAWESSRLQSGHLGPIPTRNGTWERCAASASTTCWSMANGTSGGSWPNMRSITTNTGRTSRANKGPAVQDRPAGRYDRPHHQQTGRSRPDQRVPESRLTSRGKQFRARHVRVLARHRQWLIAEHRAGRVAHDHGGDAGEYVQALVDALGRARENAT